MIENSAHAPIENALTRRQDPNIPQRLAADPDSSVWVNASAGTGKTKVLTDRLIRLMLPRTDGRLGTPPHRILCLTYTKAGAGEMLNRIMETLSKWAGLPTPKLQKVLHEKVLGHEPSAAQLEKARSLFAEVVDTPGGIKIMTIHSFCQSLLGRFPVEAALPPDFTLMSEEEGRGLIKQARDGALQKLFAQADEVAEGHSQKREHELMLMLTRLQNGDQLIKLLNQLIGKRQKIINAVQNFQGLNALTRNIYQLHGFTPDTNPDELYQDFVGHFDIELFKEFATWLTLGGKKDNEKSALILDWLSVKDTLNPQELYLRLCDIFLLSKHDRPYNPAKKPQEERPDLSDRFYKIADELLRFCEKLNALETCRKTEAVMLLATDVITRYEGQKLKNHKLDYDDLILKAISLLQNAPSWVMYKLDGGIDHILVDEAQDSNPDQWIIIDALIKEFFAGIGQADETTRTLFVVGDEKQSIFGFQGSDPDVFQHYRQRFGADFKAAGLNWRDEPLNTSFRSVQAVLDIVDHCFDSEAQRVALTGKAKTAISHDAFRFGQAGHVELWPLIKAEPAAKAENWHVPRLDEGDKEDVDKQVNPQVKMAQHIAATLRGFLDKSEILESTGKALRAGDVMILVRNRSAFVDHMIRALKEQNIPVSGVDRMVLSAQVIVQDLLALGRFALLPDDDLSLACILKSPFIGLSEEDLLDLAYGRPNYQPLWVSLKNKAKDSAELTAIYEYLNAFILNVRESGAFDFFSGIIHSPCPRNEFTALRSFTGRLGVDCIDALEEFLSRCFDHDLQHRSDVQHFIHSFEQSEESIKREIDEGQNVVRIMTVHGSKGLQAPVVFLPDTIVTGHEKNKTERFLWTEDDSGLALPLWDNTKDASPLYLSAREALIEKNKKEYERLLYVALTRAEDRLYIGGYQKSTRGSPEEHSWYYTVQNALNNKEGVQEIECALGEVDERALIYKTQQSAEVKLHEQKPLIDGGAIDEAHRLPASFLAPPLEEAYNPPRPLQPSRPSEDDEVPALSPLKSANNENRFKRGNIIHALLQFLPEVEESERKPRAAHYLRAQMPEARDYDIEALIEEVFAILENPEYAPLFCGNSKAEVPLTGTVTDGQGHVNVISGQIDRLVVNNAKKQVLVIDYKTNRPAPRDAKDIPALYKKQMNAYRQLLKQVYSGYSIKTYLLWTDYTAIMEVEP